MHSLYMNHDTTSSWDFSRVLDLVNSLSSTPSVSTNFKGNGQIPPISAAIKKEEHEREEASTGLGNFSRVWEYLGAPKDAPAPTVRTGEALDFSQLPGKEDYASDGAIYRPAPKAVKWKDQADEHDISPTLEESEGAKSHVSTAKQRRGRKSKKERKKDRQEDMQKKKEEANHLNTVIAVSDLDTDAEQKAALGAPAKRASLHTLGAPKTHNTSQRNDLPPKVLNGDAVHAMGVTAKASNSMAQGSSNTNGYPTPQRNFRQFGIPGPGLPAAPPQTDSKVSAAEHLNRQLQQKWTPPAYTRYSNNVAGPALPSTPSRPPLVPSSLSPGTSSSTNRPPRGRGIQPLSLRTGEDRYWALMLKLIANFPSDLRTLVSPSLLVNHSSDPLGIHVFVDASNIFIGFHDQLKRARGIPIQARVPRVDLSFASLALLLERRRPVAKRVLAGSTPTVPAFEEAERIGYELNVLDKVQKVKELTSRQKYFEAVKTSKTKSPNSRHNREQQSQQQRPNPSTSTDDPATTGTDSDTTPPNPAKWVEQGVDEILHLKILESIVDVDQPTTIVLATGDAAEAEYSQGFLRMVERALTRGWNVELVSWSRNISASYRKQSWTEMWGDRFRVIPLDDYAEELLEM